MQDEILFLYYDSNGAAWVDVRPVASVNGMTGAVVTDAWQTAEYDTGRTGIGGTAIYIKGFSAIAIASGTGTTTVAHGVSPLLTKPVRIHFTFQSATEAFDGSAPFTGGVRIYTKCDATNISIVGTSLPSSYTGQVILEYQKT